MISVSRISSSSSRSPIFPAVPLLVAPNVPCCVDVGVVGGTLPSMALFTEKDGVRLSCGNDGRLATLSVLGLGVVLRKVVAAPAAAVGAGC